MNQNHPLQQKSTEAPRPQQPEIAEINLSEILRIILRRKFGIIVILLLSLIGALLLHNSSTPEYRAEALLMVSASKGADDMVEAVLGGGMAADSKAAKKDVELLQSVQVAELAVRDLWKSPMRDSLEFFGNRPYHSPVSNLFSFLSISKTGHAKTGMDQTTQDHSELMRHYALKLNGRIKVAASRETNILKVSVSSPFPDESVYLTNTLCSVYKNSDVQRKSEKYIQANGFVGDMLHEQQKKLTTADRALSVFMTKNEIYEVTGNTSELLTKLVESDARYNDILAEHRIVENSLHFLEKKLTEADRELSKRISTNVNNQLGAIQDEIRSRESEYVQLLKTKNATDPELKEKKQQVEVVKTRYEQISRSRIAGQIGYAGQTRKYSFDLIREKLRIERQLNQLNFSASEYKRLKEYYEHQLDSLPQKQQQFVKLQRDREVVSKTYLFLKEKQDETRILIGSEVGDVTLAGAAFMPFKPEAPSLQKNMLMGLVLGVMLAGLYAYGTDTLDNTVKDVFFFKNAGFNICGVIPFMPDFGTPKESPFSRFKRVKRLYKKSRGERKNSGNTTESQTESNHSVHLMTDELNSHFSESFRALRTNLDYCRVDMSPASILVSGASKSEGKSTICANLAMALAINGERTLVIDCDLRRPSQHHIFNLRRIQGLTDCLIAKEDGGEERFLQPTEQDNLFVLTAGSKAPNPNELLSSKKMHSLISTFKQSFDRIVIDSPPLFLSDAAQLVQSVDGVLLAARLNYSSRFPLKEYATDSFMRHHIIGVVLINAAESHKYGYGYGYGYGEDDA